MPEQVRNPLFARYFAWCAPRQDKAEGMAQYRRRLLAGLRGRVLEVGVGTGLNLPHYPAAVEELIAVEPEPTMRAHAERAARDVAVSVRVVDGTAAALPADAASLDAIVVSGVLCSVPDPARALAEARRVLRPGGELRFFEHVRSPTRTGALLQQVLDRTVWPRMMGGCRLLRDTRAAIEAAGFEIRALDEFRVGASPAAPKILGVAVART